MILDIVADIKVRPLPTTVGVMEGPIDIAGKVTGISDLDVLLTDGTINLGGITTIRYVRLKNLGASLVPTPKIPVITNIGTPGSTTYTYKIVARQADGGYTIASPAGSTTTGNATLSATNFNRIKWPEVYKATTYDVYRTVGGATQGKIANVALPTFDDIGIAGDSAVAPATTPYDYTVLIGPDGTNYQVFIRGGDIAAFPWNMTALHHKAAFNPTTIQGLIVGD